MNMNDLAKEVGFKLRKVRKTLKLSNSRMAAQLGIGRGTYNRNEEGKSLTCIETAIKLASSYGISIGVRSGPFLAAMDRFDLKIIGKGGHGAMPHMCIDALEVGTQVVNALQRISSRHMHPLEPTVVTVGSFHAGTTFNIIPGEAEMCGTTRTFNLDIWDSWEQRLERVIRGVCESMGADFELKFSKGYPPTVNDDSMCEVVRRCAAKVVGQEKVVEPAQTMGGEDMSYFLQQSKGCFFALGAGREGYAPVHNPQFMFNEDILPLGVETHCRVALELLGSEVQGSKVQGSRVQGS